MKTFVNKYLFVMLAMMAACVMTACGDDKDDEPGGGETYETLRGVHRIDVIVPDDMYGEYGSMLFIGQVDNSKLYSDLYMDGQKLVGDTDGGYDFRDFKSVSVYTSDDAEQLTLVFSVVNLTRSYDIIVKAYYNGKFLKAETITVSPGDRRGSFVFGTYGAGTKTMKYWEAMGE